MSENSLYHPSLSDHPFDHFCTKVTDFLFNEKQHSYVIRESGSKLTVSRCSPKSLLLKTLCLFFLIATLLEAFNTITSQEYMQTEYGKAYPLFSIFGFGSGPVSSLTAFIGLSFLAIRSSDLTRSAEVMDTMLNTFRIYIPETFRRTEKRMMRNWVFGLGLVVIVRYILGFLGVFLLNADFDFMTFYTWIPGPAGVFLIYRETLLLVSTAIFIGVALIFTFLCSLFNICMEAFDAENKCLLKFVESAAGKESSFQESKVIDFEEEYIARLKTLRIHHEDINDVYDQLQTTFGIKMLFDVGGVMMSLMSNIAWFAMWSVNESLINWQTIVWHTLSLVIYAGTTWSFIGSPFLFQRKFLRMVEGIERILYTKELNTKEASVEEIGISFALRRRLQSKVLSFSAAGIIDIHHLAVSLVAALGGFLVFVTQRIAAYNEVMAQSGSSTCLSGVIINGTCSTHVA